MFRVVVVLSAVLALLGIGMATAGAADPGPRFFCFAENGAVCDQTAKNAATLDTTAGGDAGLYLKGNRFSGRALSDDDFSFDYDGEIAVGAPRLSVPIGPADYASDRHYLVPNDLARPAKRRRRKLLTFHHPMPDAAVPSANVW